MYLITNIQPNLAYVVSHYIQFMTNPIRLLSNESSFTWNIRILREFSILQAPNKNFLKVGQMLIRLETPSLINVPLGMFFYLVGGQYHGKIKSKQLLPHLSNPSIYLLL